MTDQEPTDEQVQAAALEAFPEGGRLLQRLLHPTARCTLA